MGLNDPYYNQPWTPASSWVQQANLGLNSLGQVQTQNAQLDAQRQANEANAYTAPQAPASDHRQLIGQYVEENLMAGPPEFRDRFRQEMSRGGLQAPTAPQGQPPANNLDVVSGGSGLGGTYGQPNPPSMPPAGAGYGTNQPQPMQATREAQTMGANPQLNQFNYMAGGGDMTGMSRPPQIQVAPPTGKPQPQPGMTRPTSSMTNYDVDSYMKAGGLMKSNAGLEEKKREFDAMMDYRGRALEAKAKLAKLAADAKLANNDNDRKRAIELLRIEVDREKAGIAAKARIMGGLYGIVNTEATQAYLNYLDQFVQEAEGGAQSAQESPGAQPIQRMGGGSAPAKPTGPPKPRPINQNQPTEYIAGQTYDMTGPEFPKEWKGKARFKGYDAQKNARWGRP